MMKKLQKVGLLLLTVFAGANASAQCPAIVCPNDTVVSTDPGACTAVVNYTAPVGIDTCSNSSVGGNVLFVSDGANNTATEIPAELTAAGYTVTEVYNDYNAGNNATLQGSVSQYSAIFWHASGSSGAGATHNAATFTNLNTYVTNGGAVFVTGYDVIASPTDNELIAFLGGTGSQDGGSNGTETLTTNANSLTTGVTDITGLTLNTTGDHDGLTGLQPGTISVAGNASGTSHGWSLRTLGSGEIAWVSTTNFSGQPFPAWNTAGSGYNEALLNFAFNHSCSASGNVLFVSDGANTTATELPAELTAAGYTVTEVYNDYSAGNNATLQGVVDQYDAIFWHASGSSGAGGTHNAATFTNLNTYVTNGGAVFVTGYDVIASPTDNELITFLGGTGSLDGGSNGTETLTTNANSLTTGVTDITGLTLNTTGDHDGLTGLQPGTISVAPSANGTAHGWSLRTLGSGEIAWVSTTNFSGQPFPAWNTAGSGYNEGLLNFAFNHAGCSGASVGSPVTTLISGPASGSTFPLGVTTITYEVVDGQGNNAQQCSFTITVNDTTMPIADVVTLADVTGQCSVDTLAPQSATDNCAGAIAGTHDATLPITTQGTTVVTWTYDDGNGNITTQTQNVVIADTTAPVADVATLADITGQCEVTTLTPPTATDNCAGAITGTHNATLPITATTTVTWTYDDGNGNVVTQTQEVIIPVIDVTTSVQDNVITATNSSATYQWIDCSDNSSIAGETNQSFTPTANGDYAVIVTEGGCSDTSACETISTIGLSDLSQESVIVYPNPTSTGIFTVDATGNIEAIEVIDMLGRTMNVSVDLSTGEVNGSTLSQGNYTVRMIIDGKVSITQFSVSH